VKMIADALIGEVGLVAGEPVSVLDVLRCAVQTNTVAESEGQYLLPPCITRLLSMRCPDTPTPAQSFYLACWLFDKGLSLEECKMVFKHIFGQHYDEETADTHLKLIKIKECRPYQCFMVEYGLGICNRECPQHNRV
jgi:hypothetical protein